MSLDTSPTKDSDDAPTRDAAPSTQPGGGPVIQLSHRQILLIFSGLMMGMFMAALDQTIVGTALPTIANNLHGLNHISWVVTAYLLTSTITTPLYGKLSDQFGRKGIFQFAIVMFLLGSILAGLAQSMTQLVIFRGVQGLGAGGLMAMAMTIIADIVSPRERGRYQGYFGAVFAVSSVAGPLLGGVFTDSLSWRWIFYINVPIGLVALVVTSIHLKLPFRRQSHRIDFLGAGLMMVSVTSALLVTVWGGNQYAWTSPTILGLGAVAVVFLAVFIFWERRASEPILPPAIFRIGIFRVAATVSFLLSVALYGALIYLPLYFQLVDGVSPTVSGLLLVPLMGGVLGASIISGQVVSRTGHYKSFPVIGSALATLGMFLLSGIGAHTSHWTMGFYVLILGAGVGMTMQIMILSTQNAAPGELIGTATAGVTFFRSLGGAFGASLFGAVFVSSLAHWIPIEVPGASGVNLHVQQNFTMTPAELHHFPGPVEQGIINAFVHAINEVYLLGIPIAVAMFLMTLLLKQVPLRTASGLNRPSEDIALAGGEAGSGDAEADRAVSVVEI